MLLFERSCILDSTLGHNIGGWAGHCVHVVAMFNVRQVGTRVCNVNAGWYVVRTESTETMVTMAATRDASKDDLSVGV